MGGVQYGYDFINNATDATSATKVTKAACNDNHTALFEFEITIEDPNGEVANNTIYTVKLTTDVKGGNANSTIIKESEIVKWLDTNNSTTLGIGLRQFTFKKDQNGTWSILSPVKDNFGVSFDALKMTAKVTLSINSWRNLLDYKSDGASSNAQPTSAYSNAIDVTIACSNADITNSTKDVNYYIPESSFFIGLKPTSSTDPIHQNLNEFINVDGKYMCLLGAGATAPPQGATCKTEYKEQNYTFRILNLGGVGGSMGTVTMQGAQYQGDHNYDSGVPNWWAAGQVGLLSGTGQNVKFYEIDEVTATIMPYLAGGTTEDVLKPGTHTRVITFVNCNEGSDNSFTYHLYVPELELQV